MAAAPVVNTSNGLGIFPPIAHTLQDLYTKVNIIYTGIAKFQLNSMHDIQNFTTNLTTLRDTIKKEIANLQVHTIQATNTMQTAIAAKSQSTVMTIINFIRKIIAEITSAIKCITLITQIITVLVLIPVLILAKIAELIIHAIMMAEQEVVAYLKSLLKDITDYLNDVKKRMLAYIQQQQAFSMVDGILKDMLNSSNIIARLTSFTTQKTLYNSNITNYNIDLATLQEMKADAVFGTFDIDAEVAKFFNGNTLDQLHNLTTI